jgi:RNA polymerase sigma-70 factor (ECF subfamily)
MSLPGKHGTVQRLVDEHYAALYRYAYRLSGSGADAEDLTQEAFCKAQVNLAQLREQDRAKAWLFSILRNAYLHRLRADRQQRCVSLDGVGEVAEPTPEPLPPVDPEQLQHALDELPEAFRTPVILYYFEDFSYRDIAEQMDLPLGTVMSRLARAKAHLRERLLQPTSAPPSPYPLPQSIGGEGRVRGPAVVAPGPRRATDGL